MGHDQGVLDLQSLALVHAAPCFLDVSATLHEVSGAHWLPLQGAAQICWPGICL